MEYQEQGQARGQQHLLPPDARTLRKSGMSLEVSQLYLFMFMQNLIHEALSQSSSLDFSAGANLRPHDEVELAPVLA